MGDKYRVIFKGEIKSNVGIVEARKNLAAAIQASKEKLDVLFSGETVAVKKNAELDQCAKIRNVFEKAGVICYIVPEPRKAKEEELPEEPAPSPELPSIPPQAEADDELTVSDLEGMESTDQLILSADDEYDGMTVLKAPGYQEEDDDDLEEEIPEPEEDTISSFEEELKKSSVEVPPKTDSKIKEKREKEVPLSDRKPPPGLMEVPEEVKDNKKIIIRSVVAVIICIAVGIAVWFFLPRISKMWKQPVEKDTPAENRKTKAVKAVPVKLAKENEDESKPISENKMDVGEKGEITETSEGRPPATTYVEKSIETTADEKPVKKEEKTGAVKKSVSVETPPPLPLDKVAGKIHGFRFIADTATVESNILTLKQGNNFEIMILMLSVTDSVSGKVFDVAPGKSKFDSPHVFIKWKPEFSSNTETKGFTAGYTLLLEFGEVKGGKVEGKIDVIIPDGMGSKASGPFTAIVR